MDAGTLELVELDMRLDFDHTPTCESLEHDERAATWTFTLSCCGPITYTCDTHRDWLLAWLGHNVSRCTDCGEVNPDLIWTPIR